MSGKVRKAVLPVAGLGTRVLPGAKVTPKEMLNVVDRPILSYIVEEGRAAGIEHFVFVTGRGKGAIEDYFDHHVELEAQLEAKGKLDILADIRRDLPKPGEMSFVRQMAPLGLGHAVWCARDIIGDEPFAVMLPDMLMMAEPGALAQAVAAFDEVGGNIVVVEPAPEGQAHKYGIVAATEDPAESAFAGEPTGRVSLVQRIVEKPKSGTAPSNLAVVGRYILSGKIFDKLAKIGRGAGGEIQLTDGIAALLGEDPVRAYAFEGKRYDCGSKLGYLEATVEFGLKHPGLGEDFANYLAALVASRLRSK